MKQITSFPYLRAATSSVSAAPWKDDAGVEAFPDGVFRTWDPNTDIRATRDLVIDVPQLRKDCRLGPASTVRVQATWNSSGSAVRGASLANGRFDIDGVDLNEVRGSLEMLVKGHVLRGSIALQTQIVLIRADSRDPLAARSAGSVLWSDSKEIILEGCGARFPVELVKLPADSIHAGWLLSISDDFDWPFLGSVRLYINTENATVCSAITSPEVDASSALVRSAVYHDLGRQMIAKALSSEDFCEKYDNNPQLCAYPKGSVGRALWSLLRTFLPGQSSADLNQMRILSPEKFESMLQHRFRLFGNSNG